MRFRKYILFILILLFPLTSIIIAGKSVNLKPKNHRKKVTIISSGKKRAYYSLSDKKESIIIVRGPGILRLLSRARFKPEDKNKLSYKIVYSIDGEKEKEIKFKKVKRSQKATYKNGQLGVPGNLKDFDIELGRGYHTIKILSDKKNPGVEVRYILYPKKAKKRNWVDIEPLSPYEPVELVSKEEAAKYYRFSSDKSLKVEIIGPTMLRIFTRVENDHKMKGRINYRLQVKKDGKVEHTYMLNSRKSEVTTYKSNGKMIPGKAKIVVFDVPRGKHTYEITPIDKDKKTLLGKIVFPKNDTKLEAKK